MSSFNVFHWKLVEQGNHFAVIETRSNDVIGILYPQNADVDLDELEEFMSSNFKTEEEAYQWIDSNIEYY